MLVKICGIQSIEAAQAAVLAGADLLGFVFAPSKRKVTPEQAASIVQTIPRSVKIVGVFVNERVTALNAIIAQVPLDYVQLHGQETASVAYQLHAPIIKAYSIDKLEKTKQKELTNYPYDYLLIDSPSEQYAGGSGRPFNWSKLKTKQIPSERLIIAGGLTSTNVNQAIATLNPSGVDVSSGVETNGKKDSQKIIQFITQAKGMVKDNEKL
ncbi:phosphoribosylanthranilate isomerase [Virgibacillus dokdonensis]|uniref:N-(5'-phosphoribosyl)anthranilate isomerase n=1 Tax=Virgibacillus dokdonensis TaxID=302167 RepID=A0A2K9IVH7_9BACI|nr:phosphoribosylanthranilate isomerase [Virgibacillus dokdonensis]AUJ23779.1 N-(5'-phosphoribosyl)anthranilate isomerase [Virgibacillus dokdonensis]